MKKKDIKIRERFSKILKKIFYVIEFKNENSEFCLCEYETMKEAEKKLFELKERGLI